MLPRFVIAAVVLCAGCRGAVVRMDIRDRAPVAGGRYERIAARVYFEADPRLPANRIVTDIDLAPRNARGMVEFSADLYMLRPQLPNGAVLFEVSNRGGRALQRFFNLDGDTFLLDRGFTLVWLGWQFDVPDNPDLLRLYAPVATDHGKPITGLVRSEFVPDRAATEFSLADRNMEVVYRATGNDPSARLTVRDRVEAPRRAVPRSRWKFVERKRVSMPSGFEPGRIYEVVYRSKDPVIAGLGPAAVRDLISYMKYESGQAKRAIGFGISQSGRFLRTFVYYGFNADEKGRRVFDGVIAHVAGGGRGSFNIRFAQPSRDAHPFMNLFYPTDIFPFTDLDETDTGVTDGILHRAGANAPKIFYTNSSYEYYGRAASLIHTSLDGRRDATIAPTTRIYSFAGGQHGPAPFPPRRTQTRNLTNPNEYRWSMRALLVAMDAWIAGGKEPPPSRYPRIADGTLVAPPAPLRIHKAYRVNYGPEFRTRGIIGFEPPRVGRAFAMLVAAVDADGNEIAGIRMPEVAVPLATYTGWNLRDPSIGAPDELYSMAGSWIPFPRAKIETRYAGRADYLKRVGAAARELAVAGYLLSSDVTKVIERSAKEWDYAAGGLR